MKDNKNSFVKGALCGACIMLIVAAAAGCVKSGGLALGSGKKVVGKETESKLELLQAIVQSKYLHGEDVDESALKENIYKGYIDGLDDPYSVYYDEEETKEMQESSAGEFGGIGVSMSQDPESKVITLLNVNKDAPAGKAGIENEDILYKVDGEDITSMDSDEVVAKVRGEVGTEVKITVLKAETGEEKEYTIVRDTIKQDTVYHEMKDGSIGYIYVKEFDTVTSEQFEDALSDLESQGMKGLVVDLRYNGGGNVTTVCEMLDLLLPEGTIVYSEDKDGKKEVYSSDEEHQFQKPMAVLVNQYSASASEIFAGAIQDYEKGDIVGVTTFGKGVMQNVFDLKDGTSVKITTDQWFTPNGRNVQGEGIKPDIEVEYDRSNAETDNQLQAAIDNVKQKTE